MRTILKAKGRSWSASIVAMLAAGAASAQTGGTSSQAPSPPSGPQTEKPQSPETAPAKPQGLGPPIPGVAMLGPTREIMLAPNTWFRFGSQVQAWYKLAQDRTTIAGNPDGTYAQDYYCRRCRFFSTGSVVKDVYFNILFEVANFGKADPVTGVKNFNAPSILDAYAQVKFADWFWVSGGDILMPLTRNGTQPTTTYLSIDVANVSTTPVLQGNSNVLRDLGFQVNGFVLTNHLEYRVGVFQGSRQAAVTTGTPPVVVQTASHNAPRFVTMLSYNLWDTETGYVNGGHYYGSKKVLGVMGNFDYQILRKDSPPSPGVSKNPYWGISGAAFINYPLSGSANPKGGDEIVGLFQFGYYDGGFRQTPAGVPTDPGSYPNVLKQTNYLAEAAYYNNSGRFSIFGKFEKRKISDDYIAALRAASNQTWIAGGVKYYVAPFNLLNFGLQYERIINDDAPGGQQTGTNNVTLQMQLLLY
jgi:hypothetical protein